MYFEVSGAVIDSSTPKSDSQSLCGGCPCSITELSLTSASSEGPIGPPTRAQFRAMTRLQLVGLLELDGGEVPASLSKREVARLVKESFGLEEHWGEQDVKEREEWEWLDKLQLEQREQDRMCQYEIDKLKLENERVFGKRWVCSGPSQPSCNIGTAVKFMPKFNEEVVDVFFDHFEKVATELQWPPEKWPLLVQSVLVGKAQYAFAALDSRSVLDYKALKDAVLAAYSRVTETYLERFCSYHRKPGESHLDACLRKEIIFDCWVAACQISTQAELRELVLVEQLRCIMPCEVLTFITKCNLCKARNAAALTDEYEVIHYGVAGRGNQDRGGHDKRKPFGAHRTEARTSTGTRRTPLGAAPSGRDQAGVA